MKNNEIRALMTEKNITVDDIASTLGVTKRTAQRRLNGNVARYAHEIVDLSNLFGMKPSKFASDVLHIN